MPFVFTDPGTERVDFARELAPLADELTAKYLKTLNEARRRVSETMISQPSSEALIEVHQLDFFTSLAHYFIVF